MSTRLIAALGSIALACTVAQAQESKNEVTPGNAATEVMDKKVPNMKGDCADQAKVDTKAPGTEATEAMSSEVPNMKTADASDCMDDTSKATDNN